MKNIAIGHFENLLQQVNLIKNKYDDLAEYTGENFNVFSILNVYSDELKHSAFIANLLNAKGQHGQKDTFLKLFIDEITETYLDNNQTLLNDSHAHTLKNFDTENSYAIIEKHIGKVDYDNNEGGRIDIVINNYEYNIFIENKIWAGDQYLQIKRYSEFDKKAPIIFLTLDGKEPSDGSKCELVNLKDFVCFSYEKNIIKWLEKCIKEMANKPIIRETLNQYLQLVKHLTNQSTNNKMGQEITNQILKNKDNFDAFQSLLATQNVVVSEILEEDFIEDIINKIALEFNLDVNVDDGFYHGAIYQGLILSNNYLLSKNLCIRFQFETSSFKNPLFGFAFKVKTMNDVDNHLNLKSKFEHFFGQTTLSSENFACYMMNSNWTIRLENVGNWNNLSELRFGNTKKEIYNDLRIIISKMLEIVQD